MAGTEKKRVGVESVDHERHVFRSLQVQSIVAEALQFFNETPVYSLPPPGRFPGAGVYALYYIGRYRLYAKIADLNRENSTCPIYVGKAVPKGWRAARIQDPTGPVLHHRLQEHARSIDQVTNLQRDDFRCRFMILSGLESDLVGTVEAALIRRYRPLWNTVIDGFGNHDPGAGRYNQARSEWDILHPGRPWAERLTGQSPRREDVIEKIRQFLMTLPSPS